jgi:hypothetical protein
MAPNTDSSAAPARTPRKVLLSLLIVGVLGGTVAIGSYSAFTATATNSGNRITTGTVAIGRDYTSPFYLMTAAKPGDTTTSCTRVTYTGTLSANVRMYLSTGAISPSGQWNLKVERVTIPGGNAAGDCTGYTGASTLYDGDLATFSTTYTNFGTGLDIKGSSWAQNDEIGLRVTATQNDDATANAHTSTVDTGLHTFTWEAQSA